MHAIDIAIVGLIGLLTVAGFRQGFVVGLFSLTGFIAGILIATRVVQYVAPSGERSQYAPVLAFAAGVLIAILFATLLEDVGVSLRTRMHLSGGAALDRILGAGLSGVVGMLLVWALAAVLVATPQLRTLRHYVIESRLLTRINLVLPPSGPLLNLLARYDPLPTFNGPRILVAAPDPRLSRDPQVRRASHSVVRVLGTACGYEVTGSGWWATRSLVVTNAHVVAGEADTEVVGFGSRHAHAADVVYFDPDQDISVLRVHGLHGTPLTMADPHLDQSAAILGYPENGPFDTRPARFSDTREVSSDDIYGRGPVDRHITSFRGLVRHGNSGGPVVDGDGQVLTTVFATTTSGVSGGYGVPNDLVRSALAGPLEVTGTGACSG